MNDLELADMFEDNWRTIAEFFAQRNWPDTALGRAAADLNTRAPQIIAALRRAELAQAEIKGHVRREEDLKVRIAELEETRAVLKSQMDDWLAENHKTLAARDNAAARADQAQSRIAELEKDAARYRWLRDNPYKKSARMLDELVPEELDAAIDAALKDRV